MKLMIANQQTRQHVVSLVTIVVLLFVLTVLLASGKTDSEGMQTHTNQLSTPTAIGVNSTNDPLGKQNAS